MDLGEAVAVCLAIANDRAFVVRETARDLVTLFEFHGRTRDEIHGGRDTSLAVNESHVALSLVTRPGRLTVKVYGTEGAPLDADAPDVTPPSADRGARRAAIAFAGDKLFVLHRDAPDRVRVTELDPSSTKPGRSYTRNSPRRRAPAKLIARGERLYLFDAGVLVELSADLKVVQERPFDADDVALGPAGVLLSPIGLGPGHHADVVPQLGAPAACTPTWIGAKPFLACRLAGDGSRVVRVQKESP